MTNCISITKFIYDVQQHILFGQHYSQEEFKEINRKLEIIVKHEFNKRITNYNYIIKKILMHNEDYNTSFDFSLNNLCDQYIFFLATIYTLTNEYNKNNEISQDEYHHIINKIYTCMISFDFVKELNRINFINILNYKYNEICNVVRFIPSMNNEDTSKDEHKMKKQKYF